MGFRIEREKVPDIAAKAREIASALEGKLGGAAQE